MKILRQGNQPNNPPSRWQVGKASAQCPGQHPCSGVCTGAYCGHLLVSESFDPMQSSVKCSMNAIHDCQLSNPVNKHHIIKPVSPVSGTGSTRPHYTTLYLESLNHAEKLLRLLKVLAISQSDPYLQIYFQNSLLAVTLFRTTPHSPEISLL